MKDDLFNNVNPIPALVPVDPVLADNTALVTAIIDTQGYDSMMFIILTGLLADAAATWTALLEAGDAADLSDAVAVPDEEMLGTEALASFDQSADSKCFKIGYIGIKRYLRLTLTPANNTGSMPITILALGQPLNMPAPNPPV